MIKTKLVQLFFCYFLGLRRTGKTRNHSTTQARVQCGCVCHGLHFSPCKSRHL